MNTILESKKIYILYLLIFVPSATIIFLITNRTNILDTFPSLVYGILFSIFIALIVRGLIIFKISKARNMKQLTNNLIIIDIIYILFIFFLFIIPFLNTLKNDLPGLLFIIPLFLIGNAITTIFANEDFIIVSGKVISTKEDI